MLGIDGLDPVFLEKYRKELPNLHRVGKLTPLRTTTPPQSPVAWSTFATGLQPQEHGVFDFVHRDPATGEALSSFGRSEPPRFQIPLGPWTLPLTSGRVESFRRGVTFWELLDRAGIPVQVYRMPVNYPPVPHGRAISGMGTPDLEGTFGTFTLYTNDPLETGHEVPGGRFVPIAFKKGRALLPVEGPPDPFRRDGRRLRGEIVADLADRDDVLRFRVDGKDWIVSPGEWTPWIPIRLGRVRGMFRLYVQAVSRTGEVRIYRSPLNVDPSDPALEISAPSGLAEELSSRTGAFYTQGIPEDTAAVRQGALSLEEFLKQGELAARESRALLADLTSHYKEGFLFFYFSEVDQNSHLFWGKDERRMLQVYSRVDLAVGQVIRTLADADVVVMSDHGFSNFDTAVDLNAWFAQEGVAAQAMGLNAVYLRDPKTAAAVSAKLLAWRDPITGTPVVSAVTRMGKSWSKYAPDLIVGYAAGYRAGWEAAMGNTGKQVLTANTDPWLADHCIDASLVPGVLLTKHPVSGNPGLEDLSVTILNSYGVKPDPAMKGRVLWPKQ